MAIKKLNEDTALKFQKLDPAEKTKRGILGRLYGPVASFAAPTRNGRLYTQELWEKLFNSDLIKERFANGGIFGQLCHPDYEDVDMEKIACVMPEPPVKDKNGQLIAYVDLLDTPCGKIAYQLAKYGYKLGISSRGSGDLITDYDGNESVDPETYTLTAFDLVEVPAVQTARLSFTESLDTKRYNKTLRQSLTESLKNASDEDRKIMKESLDDLGINLDEAVDVKESQMQEVQADFQKWSDANPDVELRYLIDEYGGNLGNILYNETEYNKFVDWAKDVHSITINPIKNEDSFDDVLEPQEESLEGVQLADMGQIKQDAIDLNSEGVLTEATYTKDQLRDKFGTDDLDLINAGNEEDVQLADDSFYVNETPYGFTEITYKGRVITVDGDQITVDIDGDEAIESSLESAVKTIDELDSDPNYHIEPWHDENDVKVASLKALKTMLGESMYVKKDKGYKKVAESKKEKAEPIDEALLREGAAEENAMHDLKDSITDYIVDLINDSWFEDNLAYEVQSKFKQYNSDWCSEDVNSFANRNVEQYKRTLARAETEVLFENAPRELGEELSKETGEDADYYRREVDLLLDNMLTLAKGASTDGARRLSQLIQNAMDVIESGLEDDRLQESVEDGSDIEVGDAKSDKELVAEFQESLKKVKGLEKDNLSLQEKLSASNAREVQLEEELTKYKKATASLSKSARESKNLKEDLKALDKESKKLSEEFDKARSELNESANKVTEAKSQNKKLTEQVEQLKVKVSDTSKQLDESKELVGKYRKSYKALKENYVAVKAQYYGIPKKDALQRLGESYKISDVDKTLQEMSTTRKNMSKLPIELNESVKLNKANLSIRSHEKLSSQDDTSLDPLLSLLGE